MAAAVSNGRRGARPGRPHAAAPPNRRRALSQRGGAISGQGDEALVAQLTAALKAADTADADDLTHGFHTYPARMHPRLARELMAEFSEPGALVLDPFCGSGTVLVEALVAGCRPQGVDLNPLALRISEVHCALRPAADRKRFLHTLRSVRLASEERVQTRARAKLVIDKQWQAEYEPHVLFELSGLREEIERVSHKDDQRALLVVFSSLLVKFSRRQSDTSEHPTTKRIRKGLVSEFFERKGFELCQRWEALFSEAPKDAFPARLLCGDARELPALLGQRFRAQLILTSPPYGGTYDYALQHALRNAWFGFETEHFEASEIGARRRLSKSPRARVVWSAELRAVLEAMREVVHRDGRVILWLGDAEFEGKRFEVDRQLVELAPECGFELCASAAQARPDTRGGADRAERLLLLEPR